MHRRKKVLLAASAPVFMAFLDSSMVTVALPDMHDSFAGFSLGDLSWVLNLYNIVLASALVPLGVLADRVGRLRMFHLGLVLFAGASVACALAWSVSALLVARSLQALGAAMTVPTSLSLVLAEFPSGRRATATALWSAAGAIATVAGPPLGGALVGTAGWRALFLVSPVLCLLLLVPFVRWLRDRHSTGSPVWPDALGAALLSAALATAALALIKMPEWGLGSARFSTTLLLSSLLLACAVLRSLRHPAPVLELRLLRIRSFAVASLGNLLIGVAFYSLFLSASLFLIRVWHYPPEQAGLALTPAPLAAVMIAPLAGRLADHVGERLVAVAACLLFAAGGAVMLLAMGPGAGYWTVFLPAGLLAGFGAGLALPAFGSAAIAELPRGRHATGVAVSSCSRHMGAALGVSGVVVVLGPAGLDAGYTEFRAAWGLVVVACGMAAVTAALLGRIRPEAGLTTLKEVADV